jgi:signal transduction histidine kinase
MKKFDPKKQEIVDAYFAYFNSYKDRQWDKMFNKFAKSLTMIGTGIDEFSFDCKTTHIFFKREFEQAPLPLVHEIKEIEVFELTDSIAYLMILMDMKFNAKEEEIISANNRTTAIMVKEDGEWKLTHGHWSQPDEKQDIGESIPYKILKERNKILEEKVKERTKEYEIQNIELQNLIDTKTNILSIISHDLRSPFNAFMGLTEVMLMNLEENLLNPNYFKMRLELINERAKNLYGVVDTLLNWAWTQTDKISINKRSVNVKTLVYEQIIALEDLSISKGVRINSEINNDILIISDPEILGIIIRNLISNAIKFSHRNSLVTITALIKTNNIIISINDNGVGIDSEHLNKILNTNSLVNTPGTEKEKGIGLGLSICKELTTALEGTLCFDSTPEKGTTVSVSVPIR